ncbi:MAG TPA: hypothetical protein DC053_08455 [Lachnoclostridium sp.]|nr:hypothetical protein [Lachnoclostridium sp.]
MQPYNSTEARRPKPAGFCAAILSYEIIFDYFKRQAGKNGLVKINMVYYVISCNIFMAGFICHVSKHPIT